MNQERTDLDSSTKIWNTCGYVRLSREDGDKEESNSIKGQKELIRDFLSHHLELIERDMKIDNGYSGSSFDRPAFKELMEEIKAGKINCIVVKDLSRFGRNYLDAGEYIERIFPFLGVRFIAINDNYDSLNRNWDLDGFLIPFKNLMNEAYCRDISIKIRSQLAVKRQHGDFMGSFAAYGYRKDPENKNHLLIDEFAAEVVRDIFRWKLKGISAKEIADHLNRDKIDSPMSYKKSQGLHFATPFCTHTNPLWNAATILRILKNPVYIGVLEQGKETTPSFKVKRRVRKPRSDWDVAEGTHEAVIDPYDFEIVQKILALDTRTSPGNKAVELFSGLIYCGECGASMVRKTVPSGKKNYIYYICADHKNKKTCFSHSLSDHKLKALLLEVLKKQLSSFIELVRLLESINVVMQKKASIKKLQDRLNKKRDEGKRYQRLFSSLYQNFTEGVIDQEEYQSLKKSYTLLAREAEEQVRKIQKEIEQSITEEPKGNDWIKQMKKNQTITALDREIIVLLIERILVYREKRIEIVYHWQDELKNFYF